MLLPSGEQKAQGIAGTVASPVISVYFVQNFIHRAILISLLSSGPSLAV